jgi:hypothetical protein
MSNGADLANSISAIAAVVSAIGGAFAAVAASRSATSARVAQEASAESVRRAALREVVLTGGQVLLEVSQVKARAAEASEAYQSLATHTGQFLSSCTAAFQSKVAEKVGKAEEGAAYAKLFLPDARSLDKAPPSEIDRVQVRLTNSLAEVRAIHEDLEREHASVDTECAAYRNAAIPRYPTR